MVDLIVYHNNCPDGWSAAYIAKLKYPEVELMPRDYGIDPPFEEMTGRDVLVVDYSFGTRQQNLQAASVAKSFQIFDHHKTAQAELQGLDFAVFDMKRSGAGLTWDYLFGYDSVPDGVCYSGRPWWVNYVEDRDLWIWRLPNSREINALIMTYPYTMSGWEDMAKLTVDEAAAGGKFVLRQIRHYIQRAVEQAQRGVLVAPREENMYPWDVQVLNVPYLNCSEVGNELAKTSEVSLTWFERQDNNIQFSLRSIGDRDVSEIAKTFFGGGHKNAAGFEMSVLAGRKLIDSILGRT